MKTEIKSHGDYTHTLYVNGEATVRRESFQVCANVEHALLNPQAWEPTEAHEVADRIREWVESSHA